MTENEQKLEQVKRDGAMKTILAILVAAAFGLGAICIMQLWGDLDIANAKIASLVEYGANSAEYEVTAYCPCEKCCGRYADGMTADGWRISKGDKFCAADKSIKYGTMINIPGYGTVPVKDRGGAIKGKRLDVYFDTHQAALNWGRQRLVCEVMP